MFPLWIQEADLSLVENEMANADLQQTECTTRINQLTKQLAELEGEIAEKNELIGKAEQEATKRNAVIELKQTSIDQYNKRVEQLVHTSGVSVLIVVLKYKLLLVTIWGYFKAYINNRGQVSVYLVGPI